MNSDSSIAVSKDIAYFHKVMSDYGHIMGDLDYSAEFCADYWRYIDVDQPEETRRGALAILVAQISDFIDGSGNTIIRFLIQYNQALSMIYPQTEEEDRLIEIARLGLRIAQGEITNSNEFEDELPWVYEYCVNAYFCSRCSRKTTNAKTSLRTAHYRPL